MSDSIDFEHSSTQSLNCGSDLREIHCLQQQSVAKLSRGDLEDLYYQLHDENIQIKKNFNNLDNKYKIMATRVMRLSRDHKCLESMEREEDQRQLQQSKQSEAALRAKLTVLRGQLASHTRLHSAALSKTPRSRSHHCSRSCHAPHSTCGGDNDVLLDTNRAGSQSRGQSRQTDRQSGSRSASQIEARSGPEKEHSKLTKANAALHEEVAGLQERISVLQRDMLLSSEQSRTRIHELEAELGKHLAQENVENVELIRARRTIKQQEATIASLQQEYQSVQRELQACKAALSLAARDQDEICSTLMRERQRNADLQQEFVKLSQTCSSMREIQEELNDVKKENVVLKEHSSRLLQLTTGRTDLHNSPRSEQAKQYCESSLNTSLDEIALLEETSVTGKKLEIHKQQQTQLHLELKEAQNEVSALQKKFQEAIEERNILKDDLIKVQSECSKLRKELTEPNEERRRLADQLEDVRRECAHLVEELSRSKSELQQQQIQQQELLQLAQESRAPQTFREKIIGSDKPMTPSVSAVAPLPSRPLFHTPQLSARTGHFRPVSQSYSHPSTPRPRVGDACLALLEQTAIRPSSSSFPGNLGSHGSLQERFLELCIPPRSASSSPTPVHPASVDEGGYPSKVNSNMTASSTPQVPDSGAGHSPMPHHGHHPHLTIGHNDIQWELEKCREMLRVQFNLNSIYKKEIASLNNIVQSLTSGHKDGD